MTCISLDTIYEEILDYADFEEVDSVSRARSFVTAAKRYLIAAPMSQNDQGSSITLSVAQIENMLKRAIDFVAANDASGRVSFLGVGNFFR